MVGITTADNRFGPSSFVVGTTLGDGCNYTVIQDAIDDAVAIGGAQTILIKPGTYTEDLTLEVDINLIGVTTDGRSRADVNIDGSHTLTTSAAGAQWCQIENITFNVVAGDCFTVGSPVGSAVLLSLKYCKVNATAVGSKGVVLNPTAGANAGIFMNFSNIDSDLECVDMSVSGGVGNIVSSDFTSTLGECFVLGATSLLDIERSNISSTVSHCMTTTGGTIDSFFNDYVAALALVDFSAGGTFTSNNDIILSSNGTGFYVSGTGGTYNYSSNSLAGSARNIDPALTSAPSPVRPYGESGAGPAPSSATIRGSAAFDSADFTVTDGFVEYTGTPVTYNEATGATAGAINNGYWCAAGTTLTLPVMAAADDGKTVEVYSAATTVIVTANTGQFIRLSTGASSAAGTATNTATGDTLVLKYRFSTLSWIAISSTGNWVLA